MGARPFELLKDGDLLCLIHRMLFLRVLVRLRSLRLRVMQMKVWFFKGVFGIWIDWVIRLLMRLRILGGGGFLFMLLMLVGISWEFVAGGILLFVIFIVFFVAIARAVVNHDDGGGTAPNPLVWSAGSLPKKRRDVDAVRNFAFLPGPVDIWSGDWVSSAVSCITVEDVRVWPYSVSLLVKMSAFLGTLHWPAGAVDLGVGGVSFVELLILYELWAGERLCLEGAIPKRRRVGRPISVSAVPCGPGIDIWRSCRFLGAIFRALRLLPGGLSRFLHGSIGANHGRLRHIGLGEVLSWSYVQAS